ncbi:MAG: hypothetical protein WAN65_18350 [Candidatus Sulfotelmatobacter sp.]
MQLAAPLKWTEGMSVLLKRTTTLSRLRWTAALVSSVQSESGTTNSEVITGKHKDGYHRDAP